jgi:DNA-binding HxlR family transcriptional regulator
MAISSAGKPVRGSRSGRPVMALLDLLGRRWTLRILWELRTGDAVAFSELQARCDDMSSSVLTERLRELCESGILGRDAAGNYALTLEGRRLREPLLALNDWAKSWAKGRGQR